MDLVEVPQSGVAQRHPWEVARQAFFARVLRHHGLPRPGSPVLDVGAGDAWFASKLGETFGGEIVCWDSAYSGRTPDRVGPGLSFTASAPVGSFELVLALDVLEHVEDDLAFLSALVGRQVGAKGHLLVSVPAWPALFSGHDIRLRHFRRYSPAQARSLLRRAGLEIVRGGGLFHSLLIHRGMRKLLERGGQPAGRHAGEWRASPWVTAVIQRMLGADASASYAFARLGWSVPGLSWWALCRRP